MPWGNGMVVQEASITSKYHEPTVQLLQFDNGDKAIRFCSYNKGRFSRVPLMIDEGFVKMGNLKQLLKNQDFTDRSFNL